MLLRTLTSLFKRPEPQDLLARARQLRRDDAPEQARQLCMEILRETPRDAQAMALLAALAADQGQAQAGLQWVRQALAVDPDCLQAHFALGRLHEGQERFAEAEASYRRVVQLDDSYAMGHTNLGCTQVIAPVGGERQQDPDGARHRAREVRGGRVDGHHQVQVRDQGCGVGEIGQRRREVPMRLFRQQSEGDWSAPLQELRRALAALPAGAGA
jgi:tetratricopeptide (TPR) repeat protein